MSSKINLIVPLNEQFPDGKIVPAVPHVVRAEAKATQNLLWINGEPVLRDGDTFDCGYTPKVGVKFVKTFRSLRGTGKFNKKSISLLKVQNKIVITLGDSNTTECDGCQEQMNRTTVSVAPKDQILKVQGDVALTGK